MTILRSFYTMFKLMRVHQYVKNGFILLPLFFAARITHWPLLLNALFAFVAFSICASALYIFNDIQDVNEDRLHPKKCKRPLAAGEISIKAASLLAVLLLGLGLTVMWFCSERAFFILVFYLILNAAYCVYLKHIPIMDISIIAMGFVMRLFVGSFCTDVPLSMWIVVMTFLLALFLALAKRRDDVLIFNETGKKMRKVVDGYNLTFVNNAMVLMAAVVIVAYLQYTTSPEVRERLHSDYLYLTAVFVVLGILRYLQLAFVHGQTGSPTRVLLRDLFLQLILAGWLISFGVILYWKI
ncbi:MAG: decaprenyl-phosphate phosphoribosyltransferase [Lentisphaerae bacterium]|nr:MAG: decaprenyl-phosphate phosphoribosyltransferase [Lentisphaerota bacterium]